MDDLYGDLENYNDINTIEELRKENSELRFKLEDHKSTVDKLQKDIDKLSSEFKTLEINYSSLLKTAKAEIERKTQIINNLNSEKDMLVLNSLQNTNKSLLNIKCNMARDKPNTRWKDISRTDLDSSKGKNVKDVPEMKIFETEKDRGIENRMPSTDTATSGNSDDTKRLLSVESRADTYTEKSTDIKEVSKTRNPPPGVRSRRKSMSALSKLYAKFSTDEEFEELYSAEENHAKEWPLKDDKNRKVSEKNYDKQSHKVSETSGIDDKYSSYHESSRETYYKGKSRHSDRYRTNRDKYESTQWSRRHFSPERNYRAPRDHSDDRYQRIDFGRHRILESPPPERNREYDSRRNRRSNYERENVYDDRHKLPERQGIKHKAQTDYEEPSNKRTRTNSRGRPSKEDIRWPKAQEIAEQRLLPIHLPHNMSCLSPDYIHPEIFSAEPIREIRNTASTKLEDPRLTSKRYVVKTDNKITSLCSVIGRNVEIVPVPWKIDKVKMPEALQQPPPSAATCAAQLVKNVCMDIDNPVSNLSMESGEIQSGRNTPVGDGITESLFNDYQNARPSDTVSVNVVRKENSPVNQTAAENVAPSTKYKIPKVKKVQEETISQSIVKKTNPLEMLMSDLKSKCEVTTHIVKDKPIKQKKEAPTFVKATSTIEGKLEENNPKERIKLCISLSKLKCQQPQSAREIVAGDLELSDETCDDSEMQNDNVTLKHKERLDKSHKKCKSHSSENKSRKVQDTSNTDVTRCAPDVNTTEISPESSKKQKTKRRSQKQKGAFSICMSEEIGTTKIQLDKKTRKKSTELIPHTTQDRNAKFSELFGDSSSLITPEDLGLTLVHVPPEKYVPFFEDAQDAVDVNVEEIGKAQKASISVETYEVQNEPRNTTEHKMTSKSGKSSSERKQRIKNLDEIKPDSTVEVPISTENVSLHETIKDKTVTCTEIASAPFQTEAMLNSIVSEAQTLENLVPETVTKVLDVVKTVIISTGVQSQNTTNNVELPVSNNLVEIIEKKHMPKIQDTRIHALATSTPYKEISTLCQIESDSRPESSNSEDNRTSKTEVSLDDQSSVSNLDARETDAPDIRIFVRRRRKLKK